MGTTLTGQIVAETYDSLLKVTDNNVITGTKKRITDGFGNDTPLLLSSTDVQIDGNFLLPGTTSQYVRGDGSLATFSGGLTSVGISMPSAFSVSGSPLTADGTITISGAGTTAQYIDGTGALQTFPTLASADRLITEVHNKTGATLTKGTVVYISGTQGNLPSVSKALATGDSTSAQTFGFVQSDISNNANGYIVQVGKLSNMNTNGYVDGDQLYLSPTTAGTYTTTKPYAPNHLVYVGIIVRAHPTQGIIEVKIQNGYELDELHNVSAQTPSLNDGIFYNNATSLWESKSIATALGYTPVTNARTISTTSPLSGGGDLTANRTLSIAQSTTSTDGYLSSTDWNTFNSKVPSTRTLTINGTSYDLSADRSWTISGSGISTLNTLTASTQTFATGTSGSDFNISSATSTHTFNIPDAGASARGLITTGTQTIAGAKTFSGAATFSSTINANSSIAGSGGWNAQTNTSVGSVNASTYALLGSNLCSFKQYVYTSTTSLSAGSNHATLLIASSALFEAVSGTHAIVSQLAIKPITLSNGTATTTNGATVYIEGAASGGASITNNYALWVDDGATRLDGGLLALNQFNRQTASYTLVLSDWGKIVEMNVASANNLTVPLNSSVAFPIGTEIQVLQYGSGQTTIVATGGVTLRSKSSQLKIGNQYTGVTLVKVGTDEWYVIGNVSA